MTPRERVAAIYEARRCYRTIEQDIASHRRTGYVVDTSEFFLLGRAVDRWADESLVLDPDHAFPAERCNGWLCWAFAGVSQNFLHLAPYSLSWVGWQRRGRPLRWYQTEHFQRVCCTLTRS